MADEAEQALELTGAIAGVAQAMEVFKNLEKFASAAGVIGPIIGLAGVVLKLVVGNNDSPELAYMKEQFSEVKNKLDVISDELGEVLRAIEQSTINNQYFTVEENLKNQFRKYMEITKAQPEYREKEKAEFLAHFTNSKGDQNLHTLYDGIMDKSAVFSDPILETTMKYDQRSRRLMESMCARLKELLCIGLIALIGQTAITGNDEAAIKNEWEKKMNDIEGKMKSMIDKCINEFDDQAKIDVEKMIKREDTHDHQKLAGKLCDALKKKYDWIYWSVRIYDDVGGYDNHCVTGPNYFHFFRLNGVNCVISYAKNKTPLDRGKIQNSMKGWEHRNHAREVAEHIKEKLGGPFVVHTVRRLKGLWYNGNFPSDCHFWENYSGVTLCVHSI
ncbi:protein rapunzel-like [Carcharodon carcharias]|uniref:protein rapunzel-like n=1 Tax=Carcharodon carcharias TaxID=13397 RepID=UPI001B7E1200|nr:protein rapunzel-like [Carcharodon carcharias]